MPFPQPDDPADWISVDDFVLISRDEAAWLCGYLLKYEGPSPVAQSLRDRLKEEFGHAIA